MKKKPVLLLSLLLAPTLLALDGQAADPQSQPGFSRARWLEERMERGARTPDNLVPENPKQLKAFLDQLAHTRPPVTGIPKGVVRVSQDVLAPDGGSAAQPDTETEPFFAVDPENPKHLLASYQEDRFPDEGCRDLTSAVSFDGGATWQEALLPSLTVAAGGPYERTSDPWIAFGSGGRAYFVSLGFNETSPQNGVYLSSSDDGGLTWSDPVAVHSSTVDFDDKESVVVDTRDDSPYKGRVYVGWDSITDTGQPEFITDSEDGGRSFQPPVTLNSQGANIGVVPLVGPGGIVHWEDEHFTPGTDQILLSRSTDGGQTWSAPVRVSDGPTSAPNFTPAVAVSPEGWVGVSYYSLRNNPAHVLVDEYLSVSKNGGQSFAKSLRLTASSWDLRFAATSDGFFLGDYQGLAATSKTFHPLWTGTYSLSPLDPPARQPDVFTRAVAVR